MGSFCWIGVVASRASLNLKRPAAEVTRVVDAVRPYPFDRVYGGWWDRVMREGGIQAVERSARRYARWTGADA